MSIKKNFVWLAFGLAVVPTLMTGCSAGIAPEGSTEAAMSEYEALSPEKKIKFIQGSPMPAEEKARRIKEIEDKTGVKAPETEAAPGIR